MPRGVRSNKLPVIQVGDFTGGLQSNADPADLPLNASPDCENVFAQSGQLYGRLGHIVRAAGLPAAADGGAFFYDRNGDRRLVVFSNGNIYDLSSSFTVNSVATGVYTAGNPVTSAVLNRILYFSDGETIHTSGLNQSGIRYYDPFTSTSAAPLLVSSGSANTIPTPACKVLRAIAGSLFLANIKYVGGTYAKDSGMWSNVNDPTTIISTNIFAVGQGQGGDINCVVPLGLQSESVLPDQGIFIGKTEYGCYILTGALSVATLSEERLNIPDGIKDGESAQFITGPNGPGVVVFLGNSRRVWYTDGLKHDELSKDISKELAFCVTDRLSVSSSARFTSVKNDQDFHYVLDCGYDANGRSTQFCYDWDLKRWFRYRGWPSGYWIAARDANSQPAMYVLDRANAHLSQANAGTDDNGTDIAPYWWTPWIHAGDQYLLKIWRMVHVCYRTNGATITINARVRQGEGHTASTSIAITEASDNSAVWDDSTWDSAIWALSILGDFTNYQKEARLMRASSANDGTYHALRGPDIQLKISRSSAGGIFNIFSFGVEYIARGRKRAAS